MLRRFGLQFSGRFEIRDECQVDVQAVLLADVQRELSNGLQKRLALDIADGPADLGDHDIRVVASHLVDHMLDFIGDVRNDLHGLAQELAAAFLFDDRQVDLPRRVVRVAGERTVRESLVVPQVQIGLAAVIQHIDFAVLVRTHGPRVDVDVRIELLHPHPQAALLQQHANRGAREALAQRTDHAAGHKNMLGHGSPNPPGCRCTAR